MARIIILSAFAALALIATHKLSSTQIGTNLDNARTAQIDRALGR